MFHISNTSILSLRQTNRDKMPFQTLRDRQIGMCFYLECDPVGFGPSHLNILSIFTLKLTNCSIEVIKKMLNLNKPPNWKAGDNPESEPIWKVLVFDKKGRDIISTVLRVNDLFNCGITMHM